VIVPLEPGGARPDARLSRCAARHRWQNAFVDGVGTVHDMRFVFLDNDSKLLFAPPTMATGTPISRTSRRRFPTSSTPVRRYQRLAGDSQPGGEKTSS